eukprot:TRINITY_DN4685_c0_g1_i1.p2 TRINITY_DN4685_c0_g1~~TRINITY_DN4685_c0_g1_i1.p2  ORF type:complete len:133 (+),score=44.73 TRINITY_DN4685_c0_g1_i1:60-401(+)
MGFAATSGCRTVREVLLENSFGVLTEDGVPVLSGGLVTALLEFFDDEFLEDVFFVFSVSLCFSFSLLLSFSVSFPPFSLTFSGLFLPSFSFSFSFSLSLSFSLSSAAASACAS